MSSSDIAIAVRGLSKAYTITHDQEKHITLAETLIARLKKPLRRATTETYWALKNVNFEVKKGDVVGIIGRNGAGKSTLLKVLSRITEPTSGEIDVHGRVGSLLEVGTGFHPELTGRENVYLNGAILGMSKPEIKRQFDAIVDFAGVEEFLDTPVKRYSSGMYVRLAFAVAAHLETEILVIDEVLAVGDAQFQKKCIGKMSDVAKLGRTVLFVSHNMAAVQHLCKSGVFLQKGTVSYVGSPEEAISRYLQDGAVITSDLAARTDRSGTGTVRVNRIELRTLDGKQVDTIASGLPVDIFLHYRAQRGIQGAICSIQVVTEQGQPVFLLHNRLTGQLFDQLPETGSFVLRLDRVPLPPGNYVFYYSVIAGGDVLDLMNDAERFIVTDGNFYSSGEVPPASHGLCLIDGKWRLEDGD